MPRVYAIDTKLLASRGSALELADIARPFLIDNVHAQAVESTLVLVLGRRIAQARWRWLEGCVGSLVSMAARMAFTTMVLPTFRRMPRGPAHAGWKGVLYGGCAWPIVSLLSLWVYKCERAVSLFQFLDGLTVSGPHLGTMLSSSGKLSRKNRTVQSQRPPVLSSKLRLMIGSGHYFSFHSFQELVFQTQHHRVFPALPALFSQFFLTL